MSTDLDKGKVFIRSGAAVDMSSKCRWFVLLCFCTVLGIVLCYHSFWRDEVQAWQIAVRSISISEMFHNIRYEGHPALWFLILRGFSAFVDSPQVMLVAHWLFASLNAYLILWFCPIPSWQRIACCFGYFMLFEYGVICRDYAMTASLAFVFVAIQKQNRQAIIGSALVLALLVHTTLPGAFLALSLLTYMIAEQWIRGRILERRVWIAIAVVGASFLLLVSYINPPADSLFANNYHKFRDREHLTVKSGMERARLFLRVTTPIPRPKAVHFWNTNWSDGIAPNAVRKAIQYPATVLCLALAAVSIFHRRTLAVFFCVGTLLLSGFSIAHGQTAMRHQGQWFILLLLCYWLDTMQVDVVARDYGEWQRKVRRFFPAFLFAVQPIALIVPVARSFVTPFSATPALVEHVLHTQLDPCLWSAYPEMLVAPVSAASGHEVYSPEQDQFERFSVWKDVGEPDPAVAARRLTEQMDKNQIPLLLFLKEEDIDSVISNLPEDVKVTQLLRLPKGTVTDEANVCFLLKRVR